MISFKQAIGWVQPRGQQDIKLWDDTISAVNKSPIIGKADLGFISSITSINKLERIWFYEYFKKEPSEDMKNGSSYFRLPFRASNWKWAVFHGPEVENFGTGGQKYSRSKNNRIPTVFPMRFFSTSGFDVRIFRVRKNGLLPGRGRKRKSKIWRCTVIGLWVFLLANFWIFFDCKIRS